METQSRGRDDGAVHGDAVRTDILTAQATEQEQQTEISTSTRVNICIYTHTDVRTGSGTWREKNKHRREDFFGNVHTLFSMHG